MTFDIGLHEVCVRVGVRYVITKFSRMDSLPNFLTHCAPLHPLRAREELCYYLFGKSILRRGDPGAVSWGRKNGIESFQEREKGPQEYYSWRTSFTTYSNNCLWFGAKNNLVPNQRPASVALLLRSSYTRKFNRKLDCSPYMFGSCRRDLFSENRTHKTKEIL